MERRCAWGRADRGKHSATRLRLSDKIPCESAGSFRGADILLQIKTWLKVAEIKLKSTLRSSEMPKIPGSNRNIHCLVTGLTSRIHNQTLRSLHHETKKPDSERSSAPIGRYIWTDTVFNPCCN